MFVVSGQSDTAVAAGVRELRILIARKVGICMALCIHTYIYYTYIYI